MIPLLSKIKSATENNDHGTAIEYGIKSLYFEPKTRESLLNMLARAQRQRERIGYMTPELSQERREIYDLMMAEAKKQFSEKDYSEFYSSF